MLAKPLTGWVKFEILCLFFPFNLYYLRYYLCVNFLLLICFPKYVTLCCDRIGWWFWMPARSDNVVIFNGVVVRDP